MNILYVNMAIALVARPYNVVTFIILVMWRLNVESSNSTLSFSVETAKTPYMTGQYLTLQCLAKGNNSVIEIRRTNPKISLSRSQRGHILKYTMPSVTCADMGIYECTVDHDETETTDIALSDCGPCLCCDDEVIKTIFVDINETAKFSFCVVAYMGIHSYLKINNILVTKNSSVTNISLATNNSSWSWNYVKINSSRGENSRFNITVTRDQVAIQNYGLQVIRVSASSGTLYFLDYYITLQPKGPSECPTNITVERQGLDYILLSWIPGLDGGSSQKFHAYYSTDNTIWHKNTTDIEDHSVNITGLQANTTYYFKVVSSNQYTADVNESACDNTILARAGDRSEKDKNQIAQRVRLGVLVLICVLFSFFVLYLVYISWRLKTKQNRQTGHSGSEENRTRRPSCSTHNKPARDQDAQSDDSRPHSDRQLNPGEYISEEGLKYVTLAEIKKCRWGKAKSRKRSQQDKTEYIELDFSLTGKIRLHGEDIRVEKN